MHLRFQIFILLLLSALFSLAGDFNLPCTQTDAFLRTLVKYHFKSPTLNYETEKLVYNRFIERLDPDKIIFTVQQIDSLRELVPGILDTNQHQSCIFLEKIFNVYRQRIIMADIQICNYGKKSFQFSGNDSIYFDRKMNIEFTASESEIEKRRIRQLKYYFLSELFSEIEDSSFSIDKIDVLIREKEKLLREKTITAKHCKLLKLLDTPNGFEQKVTSEFLESIALTFDPHSDFFTSVQRTSFESSLAVESGSYGLKINMNEGQLVVASLVPGGPAWKSNVIHKGDFLLKITTLKAKYQDLTCMSSDEVEYLINNSEGNWIELEFKSKGGKVKIIKLIKEKMRVDENNVNSCILNGSLKAGYISLPDFYSDDFTSGPGCANDVAKEILKMQKAGIEGLILDLRFNGGGSLDEALDLAGLFIDYGPIGIMKVKSERPQILKDPNRGTVYNGSLVILVNGYSASASELLAGALQDHNRAIIVGQPTYGKASGQYIIPVDKNNSPEYGFIKVTNIKIYRLNGESNQLSGVIPDVLIPDLYEGVLLREVDELSVLEKDTIDKKIEFLFPKPLPIEVLKSSSKQRILKSIVMQKLIEQNHRLKELYNYKNSISLRPESFYKWVKEMDVIYELAEEDSSDDNNVFSVENNTFDKVLMQIDEYKREFIKSNNENILKDAQIIEAFSILLDLKSITH